VLPLHGNRYWLTIYTFSSRLHATLAIDPRRFYIYFFYHILESCSSPIKLPLDSRINGVLGFQLLQNPPFASPPTEGLSSAAKLLFCLKCRRHRCRPKVWVTRFLHLLDQDRDATIHSEPHDSALLVHQSPPACPTHHSRLPQRAFLKNWKR
jgi:hypothetical protein